MGSCDKSFIRWELDMSHLFVELLVRKNVRVWVDNPLKTASI